jgi:hypothetical protein
MLASFPVTDSIAEMYNNVGFNLMPTTTGTYTIQNKITSDNVDQMLLDNTYTDSMQVTTNEYCKGRFNNATQRPVVSGGDRFGGTNNMVWGPLFYVAKGGYTADSIKWALGADTAKTFASDLGPMFSYIFKWTDANSDKVITPDEITLVGGATHTVHALDSCLKVIAGQVVDPSGNPNPVVLAANSWYWVVADVPNPYTLGTDSKGSYFGRSRAASMVSPMIKDYWAPQFIGNEATMITNPVDTILMYPFSAKNIPFFTPNPTDSIGFSNNKGLIPAMSLQISDTVLDVKNVHINKTGSLNLYPNPSTDYINVDFALLNTSTHVYFVVADALGRSIYRETRDNLNKGTVTISTKNFRAGEYHLMVVTDNNEMLIQKFTVVKQ